jgi:hypothetical protein
MRRPSLQQKTGAAAQQVKKPPILLLDKCSEKDKCSDKIANPLEGTH